VTRNRLVVSVLLLVAAPSSGWAQSPTPPPDEMPPVATDTADTGPVRETQPLPGPSTDSGPTTPSATEGTLAAPVAPGAAPAAAPEVDAGGGASRIADEHVPGRAIGVGLGYMFPDSEIDVPNAIAVRFRLDDRLAFEPLFRVEYSNRKTQDDFAMADFTASRLDLDVGVNARVALATAGPAQFLFIGGMGVGFGTTLDVEDPTFDPDSRFVGLDATYGVGIELFFRTRFSLSLDAVNPFVQMVWRKQSYPSGEDVKTRSYSVGAVWAPELRVIVSMYFGQG